MNHRELHAQPACVGCSGGALESLKRDSDKVIQVIRIWISNIFIKLIAFPLVQGRWNHDFVVSGLVFKQISTDKLCLNLNSLMGLSQSYGL